MATFKNKIDANCKVCGTLVPRGEGWTEGPPWITKCQPCSGRVEQALRIVVTLEGKQIGIKPNGYLADRFQTYLAACAGSFFDADNKRQLAPIAKTAAMLTRLREAGFNLDVHPAAAAAIQQNTVETKAEVESSIARVERVDAILRARGQGLYPFQKNGVAWLASGQGRLLADEMGLGKTIQALTALPDDASAIVICPSLAKGVWKREAAIWRPDLKVTVLSGNGSFRWPGKNEIVVLNFDILPGTKVPNTDAFETMTAPEGVTVIVDECHAFKSPKSIRSRKFRALSEGVRQNFGRVWLLTGTPVLNRAPELWAILQAAGLANEAFGSFSTFKNLMGGYDTKFGIEWGTPANPDEVGRRLQRVMLRRVRSEVLPELPAKTYKTVPVDLDNATKKLCDAALKAMEDRGLSLEEMMDLIASSAGGAGFEQMSRARAALAAAKVKTLLEIVESYEEAEEPVVVFSAHRAPIDTFMNRPGWAVITGETSPEQRTSIEDAFQRGDLKGVACTIKAGGVAITLTRAHDMIFVDKDFTPALNSQAEDRISRIGQKWPCQYINLVAVHALDERVDQLLSRKRDVIVNSVDKANRVEAPVVVAEVDFSKLAQEVDAQKAKEAAAQVEAEKLAAERAAEAEKARLEKLAAEKAAKEKAAKDKRETLSRERAIARGLVEPSVGHPDRHQARTIHEKWVEASIRQLAAWDPDGAQIENGIGFSKADVSAGHHLTQELTLGLTTKQWGLASFICRKYHRQVGLPTCISHEDCQYCKEMAEECYKATRNEVIGA